MRAQCNIAIAVADDDRYRLASLRDVRAVAERGKQHALASALDDTRAAAAKLDAARSRTSGARSALAAAVAARDALLTDRAPAFAVQRADAFITRRRREVAALTADEVRLETALGDHTSAADRARASLVRARGERELIDRHFARWRDARRKLAERRED
jgi:hypothetical protein